ncbi:hypothetical protein GCM10022200_23780 [Microbacterium awajiense]|uniref:Toxin HicA n=1 Tax=Microbacterium awajiense TaxID=415214 RepID=A0ABP7ATJ0_9MICO
MGNSIDDIIQRMRTSPANVRYADVCKVAEAYFGPPRQRRSSHAVYKTPWAGDPRVNLQNDHGSAKPYQVKQLLAAIERVQNGS